MTIRLLAFAASLRRGSVNRGLLSVAVELASGGGADVDVAEFAEFDMPLFNHDVLDASGYPPGAQELARRVLVADGMLIASPEYNYSLPGTLKNAIDWVSRMRPMPFRGRSAFLMAASGGLFGGIRGLWQLRIPLEGCGVVVYPDMFPLSNAREAFDDDGGLKDSRVKDRLGRMVDGYLKMARALTGKAFTPASPPAPS
jgi:chromate reductase, NAD(P)H dehydrogenase (quinone)